jgi:hypothetical protein
MQEEKKTREENKRRYEGEKIWTEDIYCWYKFLREGLLIHRQVNVSRSGGRELSRACAQGDTEVCRPMSAQNG